MDNNSYKFMKDAFAAPLGDFIASIGKGVGEAQAALDEGSLRQTLELYNGDPENSDIIQKMFREIGYQPTFYTLPKTTAKAKISLTISQSSSSLLPGNRTHIPRIYSTPVNATNANTYNLDINASAEIQFDIVPIPPSELSLIRRMPKISQLYSEYEKVIAILIQYGIAYETDKEELPESPKIKSVTLKSVRTVLIEGETILTPNDVLLIEIITTETP